jgi:hypothetical protein
MSDLRDSLDSAYNELCNAWASLAIARKAWWESEATHPVYDAAHTLIKQHEQDTMKRLKQALLLDAQNNNTHFTISTEQSTEAHTD